MAQELVITVETSVTVNTISTFLTLSDAFQLTLGFSASSETSAYLTLPPENHRLSFSTPEPSFLLGTARVLNVTKRTIVLVSPSVSVTVGSNFSTPEELSAALTTTSTSLDESYILDTQQTTEFYRTYIKLVSENWNTNNISNANRKIWSNEIIGDINNKIGKKIISMSLNRYSPKTNQASNKKLINSNYIIKL